MKVIEIGNCLPNKEPGIIISATQQELSKIIGNLLYDDVTVVSIDTHKGLRMIDQSCGVKILNDLFKQSHMKSFTLDDIEYYTNIARQIIDEREDIGK